MVRPKRRVEQTAAPEAAQHGRAVSAQELLDAALEYQARGWSIVPTKGKRAAGLWKPFQTRAADVSTLHRLFARSDITGLAVVLGAVSGGLAVRDFDGMAGYEAWAQAHPDLAATLPTVQTARGRHVYFRGPEGFEDFGDGEYRGDSGHYTVLPPSRHPSGGAYAWLIPLPVGALPLIDPHAAGFYPCNTAYTADTANTHLPTLLRVYAVLQAVKLSLPRQAGQRNRRIFDLARALKAIPDVASADLSAIRPIVAEWHSQALHIIRTKEFSETWTDFLVAWAAVKHPAGQRAIDAAFERAVASEPPRRAAELFPDDPPALLLASLCRELQRSAGDKPFHLDCRTAGNLVGIHYSIAWRLLAKVFPSLGVRILTSGEKGTKGVNGNPATRRANEYRYRLSD